MELKEIVRLIGTIIVFISVSSKYGDWINSNFYLALGIGIGIIFLAEKIKK